jgi:hypothetical protein
MLGMFSARLAWTQEMAAESETPFQFAGPAAQFSAVSEAKILFQPPYETLSLPFGLHQGHTTLLVRLRPLDLGGGRLPLTKNDALPELWRLAKIDELQVKENHLIDHTPIEWFMHVSSHNPVYLRTPDPGEDLSYYGQRIPWAGRVLLNIGEKAKIHPRVVRVVELIGPGLTFENPAPRGSGGNIQVVGLGRRR